MSKEIEPRCPTMERSTWKCPGRYCCAQVALLSRGMMLIVCPVCGKDMQRAAPEDERAAGPDVATGAVMGVITSLLTAQEAIIWEWMDSRTHDGGLRWVAAKLGITEARAEQLLWSAERKIYKRFQEIEGQDPETQPTEGGSHEDS